MSHNNSLPPLCVDSVKQNRTDLEREKTDEFLNNAINPTFEKNNYETNENEQIPMPAIAESLTIQPNKSVGYSTERSINKTELIAEPNATEKRNETTQSDSDEGDKIEEAVSSRPETILDQDLCKHKNIEGQHDVNPVETNQGQNSINVTSHFIPVETNFFSMRTMNCHGSSSTCAIKKRQCGFSLTLLFPIIIYGFYNLIIFLSKQIQDYF